MDASMQKRDLNYETDNFCIPNKAFKFDNTDDEKLSEFLSWCTSEGIRISRKVIKLLYMRRGVASLGCVENTQRRTTVQRRHCGVSLKHDRTGGTKKMTFRAQGTADGTAKTSAISKVEKRL